MIVIMIVKPRFINTTFYKQSMKEEIEHFMRKNHFALLQKDSITSFIVNTDYTNVSNLTVASCT